MPKPNQDESKDDFLNRCIPMLIDEGHAQNQAVAECEGLWREHMGGKEVVTANN